MVDTQAFLARVRDVRDRMRDAPAPNHMTHAHPIGRYVTGVFVGGSKIEDPVTEYNIAEGWALVWREGDIEAPTKITGDVRVTLDVPPGAFLYLNEPDIDAEYRYEFGKAEPVAMVAKRPTQPKKDRTWLIDVANNGLFAGIGYLIAGVLS